MRVRSDYTLRLLLIKLKGLSPTDDIRASIQDAINHMGESSPYHGGNELVSLLESAAATAARDAEEDSVTRIRDALRYATNQALKQDIEIKYQLFEGSRRRTLEMARKTVASAFQLAVSEIDGLLEVEPAATGARVREHIANLHENSANLSEDEGQPGKYRLLRGEREIGAWVERVLSERLAIEGRITDRSRLSLMPSADPSVLAEAFLLGVRRSLLNELRATISNPHSSESDLQRSLVGNVWIFGGDYISEVADRRMVERQEFDIPILRPDGSLHVVELKRANVRTTTRHRGSLIPNSQVHRAVGQVMNYLLALDENRGMISERYGIEVRRTSATVVIGHPKFQSDASEAELNTVLRMYNAHLARVDVMTYKQLIDSAERALDLGYRTLQA